MWTSLLARGSESGLIGESGSGKSLTALSVLGLLPEDVHAKGSVQLAGTDHDLIGADERQLSRIRGRDLAMVFQEPMTALNPTMRIGDQIAEAMLIHNTVRGRSAARAAAKDLLDRVQLPGVARAYPHRLSGGQRQRVVVAIALANDPALLICDEPTTALDVTVQAMILDLILQGVAARESALLFITHDLAVIATICNESGHVRRPGSRIRPCPRGLHHPAPPLYPRPLAASDLDSATRRLPTIPGNVPPAGSFPPAASSEPAAPTPQTSAPPPHPGPAPPPNGYACHRPSQHLRLRRILRRDTPFFRRCRHP